MKGGFVFLVLCCLVTVIQHYLHTSLFTWMLVEGINLYIKLVKVFPVSKPYLSYLMMGWGLYLYISTIRPLIAEFFSRRFHKWKHFCRISFPCYSNLDFSDIICKMLPEKKKKRTRIRIINNKYKGLKELVCILKG